MRVLVACEFSGVVREAFRRRGHAAYSCDLLPAEDGSQFHFQEDVIGVLNRNWITPFDLVIAHPPCNHLAASGAQYWKAKQEDGRQAEAAKFFMEFTQLQSYVRVAIENPVGIMSSLYRKPDQIIQPWQFGDPFNKKTCLWLIGLPPLMMTHIVQPTHNWGTNSWRGGGRKRSPFPSIKWDGHARSRSFSGIADAMAEQWGSLGLQ